jgi:GWxTD domain-containing protein
MKVNKAGYIVIGIVALLVIGASWQKASDAETRLKLAQVDSLAAAGSFKDAAALIEGIDESLFPDTVVLLRKGIIYRQLDDVESRHKSAHYFRKLVDRYPTTPRFYIELARTLLAQSFDDEAKLQLRKAIELNPIDETPYLLLFNIFASRYYINSWKSEADKAESTLQTLLRQVPSSRNGLCKLASLQAVRGNLSAALGNAQHALALDSAAVDINLVLGYIQYQLRHYEQCQHHYDTALAKMKRSDRWVYTTVECVLPPEMAAEYPYWQAEVRDSTEHNFWRTRDSDPTTEINERLLEHYSRVWEANLYFGTPENGGVGWRTPMGATLVRMGRPDGRRRALVEVHWSKNRHFIDESPVWYWNYGSTEIPCSFAFLDRYMNNNFTYPRQGYDSGLSPIHQASEAIAKAIFTRKPEQSSLLRSSQPIGVNSEIYQFRAGGGQTAALIHVTVPVRDISFDTTSGEAKARLSVRGALRSKNEEVVWQKAFEDTLKLGIREARCGSGVWRDMFTLEATSGTYRLALACEQPQSDRFGLINSPIEFQDFDSAVALSDLLLTSDSIANPTLGDIWKGRYSGKVIPRKTFSLAERLTIYFEIYNLPTDIYRQTSYEIAFALQLVKPVESGIGGLMSKILSRKRESITTTLHEVGRNRDLARALVLDVSEMREGSYTLTMRLTDLIFNRAVSKTTTLTLTP